MKLRDDRPALREAFKRQGRNVDQASHQEMRTLVCAQCHVEYYFKGEGNYLTFPWDKGPRRNRWSSISTKPDSPIGLTRSAAKMVKMRHPDYEVYRTGVHAYRDIACADCHMPYRTEGGVKFTDHHIQSPLLNIANSCAVCHRWSEKEIRGRVEGIQDKIHQARGWTENDDGPGPFRHCRRRRSRGQQRGIGRRSQTGPRTPNCDGTTWPPATAWASTRRRSPCGFSPRPSIWPASAASKCTRILAKHGVVKPVNYPDFSTKAEGPNVDRPFVGGKPPSLRRP